MKYRSDVFDTCRAVLENLVGKESVKNLSDLSRLTEDVGMDSLGVIELQLDIEDKFDIEIADEEWDGPGDGGRVETFGQVVDLVVQKVGEQQGYAVLTYRQGRRSDIAEKSA